MDSDLDDLRQDIIDTCVGAYFSADLEGAIADTIATEFMSSNELQTVNQMLT